MLLVSLVYLIWLASQTKGCKCNYVLLFGWLQEKCIQSIPLDYELYVKSVHFIISRNNHDSAANTSYIRRSELLQHRPERPRGDIEKHGANIMLI